MSRPAEIAVFLAGLMAVQAARTGIGCRSSLKTKYFGFVAAALDVRFARAMARFASMPLRSLLRVQCGGKVRCGLKIVVEAFGGHVFVAGLAGIRADVEGWIGWPHILLCMLLLRLRFTLLFLG